MPRQLLYQERFCIDVIGYGHEGYSITTMAVKLGVTRDCLYKWVDRYPNFKEAMKQALEAQRSYYDEIGRCGLAKGKFQTNLYKWIMATRFKEQEDNQVYLNLGGQPNNPVQHVDLSNLTTEQLNALESIVAVKSSDNSKSTDFNL